MSEKKSESTGSPSTSSPPSGGISRFVGVGVSLITGLVIFTIGVSLFPAEAPHEAAPSSRTPVRPAPPVTPPPPAPPAEGAAAAGDGGGADAAATAGPGDTDGGQPSSDAKSPSSGEPERPARKPVASGTGGGAADGAIPEGKGSPGATVDGGTAAGGDDDDGAATAPTADCTLPDKDIAREAWRHNWPTICPVPEGGKAFIIIPVKGSIDNAVVDLKRKPVREARVTLPAAESQLTLKLYKLKRLGFKDLKIAPPDDGPGARFRVRLMNGAGDPVFDVKDGYAKITVATPE